MALGLTATWIGRRYWYDRKRGPRQRHDGVAERIKEADGKNVILVKTGHEFRGLACAVLALRTSGNPAAA